MTFTLSEEVEITENLGTQVVRGQVTGGTTGTFKAKFGHISNVVISDETTAGVIKASWSGSTITITCTQNDYVNLVIHGR